MAADILYVISLGLSKMVVLHFMLCLAGSATRRSIPVAVMFFNTALTVVAIFAIGFQCNGSSMLILSDHCFNQASLESAQNGLNADLGIREPFGVSTEHLMLW